MAGAAKEEPTPLRAAPANGVSAAPFRGLAGVSGGAVVVVVVVVDAVGGSGWPLSAVPPADADVAGPDADGCPAVEVPEVAAAAGPAIPTTATIAAPRNVTAPR